jgi:hypothetical protein
MDELVHRSVTRAIRIACVAISIVGAPFGHGHGGVVAEDDLCLIRIGFLEAHFTIFQPDSRGHDEFCEDVPAAGNTLFVMEFMHDALRDAQLELRIIRNVTAAGRFANRDDIAAIDDLERVTVYHHPPAQPSLPLLVVQHHFAEPGDYIGIVVARLGERRYEAIFPFAVGATGYGLAPWFVAAFILLQLGYWIANGGPARLRSRRLRARGRAGIAVVLVAAAGLALLADPAWAEPDASDTWTARSSHDRFLVTLRPEVMPLPLNVMHGWTIEIENRDGAPLDDAEITVTGGMPTHDHGLPTAPRVTGHAGEGRYTIEGVRFHMPGSWRLEFSIRSGDVADTVAFDFEV